MTNLNTLASRVEDVSGPDRELDAEIGLCLGLKVERVTIGPDHRREEIVTTGRKAGDHAPTSRPISRYTASLDAALTLVPGGCSWRVGVSSEPRKAILGGSAAEVMQGCFGKLLAQTGGATPALALCAASLRAISSMENTK